MPEDWLIYVRGEIDPSPFSGLFAGKSIALNKTEREPPTTDFEFNPPRDALTVLDVKAIRSEPDLC